MIQAPVQPLDTENLTIRHLGFTEEARSVSKKYFDLALKHAVD